MLDTIQPFILPVLSIIAIVAVIMFVVRRGYQVAEPNEALIISGFRAGQKGSDVPFKIVVGHGTLVYPVLQQVRSLSLKLREAELVSNCPSIQGIQVKVQGVCMYKIGDTPEAITNAARRFLDVDDDTIDQRMTKVLDGHLRSILGNLRIEEILQNREKLTGETLAAAGDELAQMGLVINSLQIIDVIDSENYIKSMAAPHVAEIQKAARIAQAAADQSATVAEQEANANKAAAVRDAQIKQANYQAEVDAAKATSAQQGPLAEAKAQQAVMVEQTRMTELEAARKEQELQVSVRRPADAEAYAVTVRADANKKATIANAEAAAQQTTLEAQAKAAAARILGEGEAAATEARGLAEGKAIQARVLAEAEGIRATGEALSQNSEANIQKILAENMPAIVAAAAKPFESIQNFNVLDGAEGVSKTMASIMSTASSMLPALMEALNTNKINSNKS